jgi:hypothetical protein
MSKSPLETVKERFKNKDALVTAVKSLASTDLWLDRLNGDKGWDSVSNKKLLRLHETLSQVKKQFGSRAKLIDAIAAGVKRAKDADYKKGLERFPTPRLFEIWKTGEKQKKRTAS